MKKKVLVFFPHNPWPPRSGAHRRCLEVIGGLKSLGYDVALTSSSHSFYAWNGKSINALLEKGVSRVELYEPTARDEEFLRLLSQLRATEKSLELFRTRIYLIRKLLRHRPPIAAMFRGAREVLPTDAIQHTPPDMRRWYSRVAESIAPDAIVMNYACFDGIIDHHALRSQLRVIDTLDLVSLNWPMQEAIAKHLPKSLEASEVPDEVLSEDFFKPFRVSTNTEEFRIFDRYDRTIAICAEELEIISRYTRRTKTSWLPVTLEPNYIENTYSDTALFTLGPNFFNLQGYLYFVKKVLPNIQREIPSFVLRVTGTFPTNSPPQVAGIILSGFVPDLIPIYETARLYLCPVFGGTGQQIKIIEAMAHGLAVVALRFAAERSGLCHEVNGLVADNAEEFAQHVARLWRDPQLCRRMGACARETVASQFSQQRLLVGLSEIFDT